MIDDEALRAAVAAIPPGRWATYRDVALAAGGTQKHARTLNGRFLRASIAGAHRVLRDDGSVAPTALGDAASARRALVADGVLFRDDRADAGQRITLQAAECRPEPAIVAERSGYGPAGS